MIDRPCPVTGAAQAAAIRRRIRIPLRFADGYSTTATVVSFTGLTDAQQHVALEPKVRGTAGHRVWLVNDERPPTPAAPDRVVSARPVVPGRDGGERRLLAAGPHPGQPRPA